jgi:cell division protein FtsW
MLGVLTMAMMFLAGARLRHMIMVLLIQAPLIYVLIFKVPYRRARILSFLNPWEDPTGQGFQIVQSMLAFGSGSWWGLGLGQGQQKLYYLPEPYNDFIFAVIGEELGFFAVVLVVALFAFVVYRGLLAACRARDDFGFLLGWGLSLALALQAILNMGVAMGLFPTKGMALPLISYGGSSLMVTLMSLGVLLNISRRATKGA